MPSYYLELPETGISAEVQAPSTRSAQTTYLDYLTRNKIVPWKGRNALRPSIITDRIESGQMDVDVNLNYTLEAPVQEASEVTLGPESQMQTQFNPPPIESINRPLIETAKTDIPSDVPKGPLGGSQMPIQSISKSKLAGGQSKIELLSKRTLGKGRF